MIKIEIDDVTVNRWRRRLLRLSMLNESDHSFIKMLRGFFASSSSSSFRGFCVLLKRVGNLTISLPSRAMFATHTHFKFTIRVTVMWQKMSRNFFFTFSVAFWGGGKRAQLDNHLHFYNVYSALIGLSSMSRRWQLREYKPELFMKQSIIARRYVRVCGKS
jgi:hypothetical protein